MSKYTVMVKNIVESKSGLNFLNPLSKPNYTQAIAAARQRIFNFNYPIFSESYREVLETKILKHFYMREIAFETYGQWQMKLDDMLNNIMPYYNQLYDSAGLDYDPFTDTDYTITHDGDGTKNGTYDNTETRTYDLDISQIVSNEKSNFQKTDNITTGSKNETLKNTHTDAHDITTNDTTTYNVHDVVDKTGTQRNNYENNQANTGTDTIHTAGTETGTNNNEHWDLFSDTPQGEIDNFKNPGYYTNIKKATDTGGNSNESTGDSETTYGHNVKDIGDNTRTDNLKESSAKTGTEQVDRVTGDEITGEYSNTTTSGTSDLLDGTVHTAGEENGTKSETQDSLDKKTGKNTEAITTTDDFIRHITGKRGSTSYSRLLLEYRETLLNIDMMILEELEPLFFLLW